MDRIETEKNYPQKVEVVNPINVNYNFSNPLPVTLPGVINPQGNALQVVDQSSHANEVYVHTTGNAINGFVSCVQVVNDGIGYIFPINQDFFNIANATTFQASIVPSLHSSFAQKFPSATSIIVFYSYQTSARVYTFDSYAG